MNTASWIALCVIAFFLGKASIAQECKENHRFYFGEGFECKAQQPKESSNG